MGIGEKGLKLILPYSGKTISTFNPIQASWDELLRLRDISFIKEVSDISDEDKLVFIKTSIIQAHEYFTSSLNMSLNTSSLLLYYSILNLSKAFLVLANNEYPSQHHGLSKVDYSGSLLDINCKYTNGIFGDLARMLDVKIESKIFSVSDFMLSNVDLYFEATISSEHKRSFVVPEICLYTGGSLDVIFTDIENSEFANITKTFEKYDEFKLDNRTESSAIFTLKNTITQENRYDEASSIIEKYFILSTLGSASRYFYINNNVNSLHPLLSEFGVLFILSNIVRYSPQKLDEIINSNNQSKYWLLSKIVEICKRSIPNLFVNLLYGENIVFNHY